MKASKRKTRASYSFWRTFASCRRRWRWSYGDGIWPRERPEALEFGTVMHEALDIYWRAVMKNPRGGRRDGLSGPKIAEISERMKDFVAERLDQWDGDVGRRHRAMAVALCSAYPRWEQSIDEGRVSPISIETTAEMPIRERRRGWTSSRFTFTGRVDMLVIDDEGAKGIAEFKTTGDVEDGIASLKRELQVRMYLVAARRSIDPSIDYAVCDFLGKPKLRGKAGESEHELAARMVDDIRENGLLRRERLHLGENDEDLVDDELWSLSRSLVDAERNGTWYRDASHCRDWGRDCEYLPLCEAHGELDVQARLIDDIYNKGRSIEQKEGAHVSEIEGREGRGKRGAVEPGGGDQRPVDTRLAGSEQVR